MKVEWLPAAISDRRTVTKYLLDRNPEAALRLLRILIATSRKLAEFPDRGRPGRIAGTREIVLLPSYIMVYKVDEDAQLLSILRIWHAAQDR